MSALTRQDLEQFAASHDAFVAIDSDGCVFDTMDVKQKQFMHPKAVELWGLEAVADRFHETADYVTLHSPWRGANRFPGLVKTFELLAERLNVDECKRLLPPLEAMRAYIESGLPTCEASLADEADRTGDPQLRRLLEWSRAIDADMREHMPEIPPFDGVCEGLEAIHGAADAMVVSQTAEHVLAADWSRHDLARYVQFICGPELGKKDELLRMAAHERYARDRILMMGDAPGDRRAADAIGALFYPILPGREPESWRRFTAEAFPRFLDGTYADDYQDGLIRAFEACLSDRPPWA